MRHNHIKVGQIMAYPDSKPFTGLGSWEHGFRRTLGLQAVGPGVAPWEPVPQLPHPGPLWAAWPQVTTPPWLSHPFSGPQFPRLISAAFLCSDFLIWPQAPVLSMCEVTTRWRRKQQGAR